MKNILVVSGGNAKYSEKRQDLIKGGYEYFQNSNKKRIEDFSFLNSSADISSLIKCIEYITN